MSKSDRVAEFMKRELRGRDVRATTLHRFLDHEFGKVNPRTFRKAAKKIGAYSYLLSGEWWWTTARSRPAATIIEEVKRRQGTVTLGHLSKFSRATAHRALREAGLRYDRRRKAWR